MQTNRQVNSPVKWEVLHGFCSCSSCCWWWWSCLGTEWIRQLLDKTGYTAFYAPDHVPNSPKECACGFHVGLLSVIIILLVSFFLIHFKKALKIKTPDDLDFKEPYQSGFRELCQHLSTNHVWFFFTLICKTERKFVTIIKLTGIYIKNKKRFATVFAQIRESKTVLDSRFLDFTPWIPDSSYCIPNYLSVELGSWIPIVSGIPDSLSCIPDSKAQDFGFHKQKFPNSTIRIPLRGAIFLVLHSGGLS